MSSGFPGKDIGFITDPCYKPLSDDQLARIPAPDYRQQAFGAAKKILEQIDGLLNARTDSLQARDIKDLSLAFNKLLGCVSGFTPGGQQAVARSNLKNMLECRKKCEVSGVSALRTHSHQKKTRQRWTPPGISL